MCARAGADPILVRMVLVCVQTLVVPIIVGHNSSLNLRKMKKVFLFLIGVSCSLMLNAQQIVGGFACADPDAWFNKEIFFAVQNNCRDYYGWPMILTNVEFCVNGENWYKVDFWEYGKVVRIEDEMKKGTVVTMYYNGQYYYSWQCTEAEPALPEALLGICEGWVKRRTLKAIGKKAIKIIKKVKK